MSVLSVLDGVALLDFLLPFELLLLLELFFDLLEVLVVESELDEDVSTAVSADGLLLKKAVNDVPVPVCGGENGAVGERKLTATALRWDFSFGASSTRKIRVHRSGSTRGERTIGEREGPRGVSSEIHRAGRRHTGVGVDLVS